MTHIPMVSLKSILSGSSKAGCRCLLELFSLGGIHVTIYNTPQTTQGLQYEYHPPTMMYCGAVVIVE